MIGNDHLHLLCTYYVRVVWSIFAVNGVVRACKQSVEGNTTNNTYDNNNILYTATSTGARIAALKMVIFTNNCHVPVVFTSPKVLLQGRLQDLCLWDAHLHPSEMGPGEPSHASRVRRTCLHGEIFISESPFPAFWWHLETVYSTVTDEDLC